MRAFIILCLVAAVCAEHSGYEYQQNSGFASDPSGGSLNDHDSYSAPVELEKEFYTYSAPEGEFNDPHAAQHVVGAGKQRLRVVFIKGPESTGLEDAALTLAKQTGQDKTVIYVLNKQADLGNLADKLSNVGKNTNRPEVHFVKYRTPEDAANAQRAIQSQYDSLGGRSQHVNGGLAPVLNFASQAPSRGATVLSPQNSYLPASIFRRRS